MIRRVLLGNEAIAWGLLKEGATVLSSYPGTPASEILETAIRLKEELNLEVFAEWAINEKVALELALANSWLGGRSAAIMKQVGLNVALDPLMSAAYTGVRGGLIIVSADDPGPYSSQTEQDSRFLAMFAKIPVLDPSTPKEAMEMVRMAFELSERYGLPVMLRPVSWVCHARQGMELEEIRPKKGRVLLEEKDLLHWAATPRRRYVLHRELNEKISKIAEEGAHRTLGNPGAERAIVTSGFPFALLMDTLKGLGREGDVCVFKVDRPYPLPQPLLSQLRRFKRILVLEETYPVMELQLPSRDGVLGRLDGTVPSEGEMKPETVLQALGRLLEEDLGELPTVAEGEKPRLCPGCPHRAAFWALKEALPGGYYPSDIGCYTLGLNMGAVDAFLCMGAGVSLAEGFYLAMKTAGVPIPPIGATVGDSTFFHACIPALIDAVNKKAAFVLLILDNGSTAMTGGQPTPAMPPQGLRPVSMEGVIRGCGIDFLEVVDPYDVPRMVDALRRAHRYCREREIPAVVISRRPCPLLFPEERREKVSLKQEECVGCMICVRESECPVLTEGENYPLIDAMLCNGCGLCVHICPQGALVVEGKG